MCIRDSPTSSRPLTARFKPTRTDFAAAFLALVGATTLGLLLHEAGLDVYKRQVYLSVVLRPRLQADAAQYLTCAAAVSCAQAIEAVTGEEALIKWVNDIFCRGRKVAGILTEGVVDMESGRFEHAVLGMGVNCLLYTSRCV